MSELNDEIRTITEAAQRAIADKSWCHVIATSDRANERAVIARLGPVTRRVRGRMMRTNGDVDDEFAAAWQFDDYFGTSPGAFFHDSLGDLHLTWPTRVGFVVVITQPDQVLVDEPLGNSHRTPLSALVQEFDEAAEWYAEEEQREPDDPLFRGPLSFDVILVTDAEHRDEVVRRWKAAGAPLDG